MPDSSAPPTARRRFGQHFLVDASVVDRILACLAPRPGETIVEIGPGGGALTAGLIAAGARVEAIEIDRDLIAGLHRRFGDAPNFRLHTADALRFDFESVLEPDAHARVVGNLPYNISTPILFRLFHLRERLSGMLFMLQKEVVSRLAAAPGGAEFGRLSVMAQAIASVVPLFDVPPASFQPPPRVQSSVVQIVPIRPTLPDPLYRALSSIVQLAFSQRRKMVRHTLGRTFSAAALAAAEIESTARPQQLTVAQYVSLARASLES